MVAGPCKKALAAQDCQEEKNGRCQTDKKKQKRDMLVETLPIVFCEKIDYRQYRQFICCMHRNEASRKT